MENTSAQSASQNSLQPDRKVRVLVVEDEPDIIALLRYNLLKAGFDVNSAEDGRAAIANILDSRPDIILLDWMLPGLSGFEVCRRLRANSATAMIPIIMLTAKGEEKDKIAGLDVGADDYITKPFSPAELIARVQAVARRLAIQQQQVQDITSNDGAAGKSSAGMVLERGDITLNRQTRKVKRRDGDGLDGKIYDIHLGPTEFELLACMMTSPTTVFSREELLARVWPNNVHVELRTVDVHIRRLRRSLNCLESMPDVIRTVRLGGYAFEPEGYGGSSEA